MLIDDVTAICQRLAPHGWGELLAAHGLDLGASDLTNELSRELSGIDRSVPGFEDFALEGRRGIEPGEPARSLLFHAFASAGVVARPDAGPLADFPTAAEIDVVENLVYGTRPPSLPEVLARAGGRETALVAFAVEYRPAIHTPHRRHADLCLARTGVARVGTAPARYDQRRRGYLPSVEAEAHGIRVLPSRFAAYVAALVPGSSADSIPMRFRPPSSADGGDGSRQFWVPLHKLFDGAECLRGRNIDVTLEAHHVNEKLRRVHLALGADASWGLPEIDRPPFRFTDGIATVLSGPDVAPGTVAPIPHERLVEAAELDGAPLTFHVPANEPLSSSLTISAVGRRRPGPEYVHVRHAITGSGQEEDLSSRADVVSVVAAGGYRARHYIDFTGDGWVVPVVPQLAVDLPRVRAAYSLVSAPDFFPTTDQRELTEWTAQQVPSALRSAIWRVPPDPLSDERFPPNLQLTAAKFRPDDDTVTAIVPAPVAGPRGQTRIDVAAVERHTHLPDDAAGVFAPGWDVSVDGLPGGPDHLAAYGLGSPFPEDAKLCAALSSFWPAVAPDAARTFEPDPRWPSVAPMTDEEIGTVGSLPWDGVPGPRLVQAGGETVVEYTSFDHADYVRSSLQNRFSLALTARIDDRAYQARILAMVRAYAALGVDLSGDFAQVVAAKARWTVVSFRSVSHTDSEVGRAVADTGATVHEPIFRFEVITRGPARPAPGPPGRVHVPVRRIVRLLVEPVIVLTQEGDAAWQSVT